MDELLYPQLKWIGYCSFEGMPENITIDEHLDVELLVSDYYLVKTILDLILLIEQVLTKNIDMSLGRIEYLIM